MADADRFVAFDGEASAAGGLPGAFPERSWGRRDGSDPSHALCAVLGATDAAWPEAGGH